MYIFLKLNKVVVYWKRLKEYHRSQLLTQLLQLQKAWKNSDSYGIDFFTQLQKLLSFSTPQLLYMIFIFSLFQEFYNSTPGAYKQGLYTLKDWLVLFMNNTPHVAMTSLLMPKTTLRKLLRKTKTTLRKMDSRRFSNCFMAHCLHYFTASFLVNY